VDRIRRHEPAALRDFFFRFEPLLMREAHYMRVPPDLRREMVTQCLNDAAVTLRRYMTPAPRSLHAYLLTAFRHDIMNARRDERRRHARHVAALREGAVDDEWVVPETASEHALRTSAGPDNQDNVLAPALERLASALDEGLSVEERQLLTWIGHWVPQRVIADWLGVTYGAVRVRVLRLRERLREAAIRYARQLSNDEQRALQRFFQRTSRPPSIPPSSHSTPNDTLPAANPASRNAGE
jgi:RNA polymerase sigma factor (sigma-70 family)